MSKYCRKTINTGEQIIKLSMVASVWLSGSSYNSAMFFQIPNNYSIVAANIGATLVVPIGIFIYHSFF